MKHYPNNLNTKPKWCAKCEVSTHSTSECQNNCQNNPNYHNQSTEQNKDQGDIGGGYQGRGEYIGGYHHWYKQGGCGQETFEKLYYFIYLGLSREGNN